MKRVPPAFTILGAMVLGIIIGYLIFIQFPDKKRPWRVDNTAKAILDDVASRLKADPNAKIVKGYQRDIMPVFEGQIGEDGLLQLIAYVKSLSTPTPSPAKTAAPPTTRSTK